jgi:hypothetical protein
MPSSLAHSCTLGLCSVAATGQLNTQCTPKFPQGKPDTHVDAHGELPKAACVLGARGRSLVTRHRSPLAT